MKMHPLFFRGAIASVFFLLAAPLLDAAPRDNSASTAPQFFLRVDFGTDSGVQMWEVIGWSHEIVSPRDAASGLPTGKRQHKPFTISKVLDQATPLLLEGLVSSRLLPSVELVVVRTGRDGNPVPVFSIRLTKATVVDVLTSGGAPDPVPHVEQVSFVYESIEWNSEEGGTTASDDWIQP